jgi:hypothetical protein
MLHLKLQDRRHVCNCYIIISNAYKLSNERIVCFGIIHRQSIHLVTISELALSIGHN